MPARMERVPRPERWLSADQVENAPCRNQRQRPTQPHTTGCLGMPQNTWPMLPGTRRRSRLRDSLFILVWALSGPIFNYSDTWQLVINTGTTIVTFLMVFLIQNSQNRDGAAIQAKLDEIVRAGRGQNVFVGIEHLTEDEIEELTKKCEARAKKAASRR